VASEPPRVAWTQESRERFQQLPFVVRSEILASIELIRSYPRMFQIEVRGRWRGLRRFLVRNWKIYYEFWDTENTLYIETIWPGRADDSEN
jgi:hypothetical protein